MYAANVYKIPGFGKIDQLDIKRDWMDQTFDRHAYNCFPVSLSNGLGWGITFPEDISFVWDGISDSLPNHVKILKGEKYCITTRGNATVSFHTGLTFKTKEDITILTMPVPNQFIDGAQAFTTLVSTSFFNGELPIVWRITRPNIPITIKAGTPIAAILPISLGNIQNSEIIVKDYSEMKPHQVNGMEYGMEIDKINRSGKWANFYRNATDHRGNIIGKHEVKALRLKTINE